MESPKVQKASHWLSKVYFINNFRGLIILLMVDLPPRVMINPVQYYLFFVPHPFCENICAHVKLGIIFSPQFLDSKSFKTVFWQILKNQPIQEINQQNSSKFPPKSQDFPPKISTPLSTSIPPSCNSCCRPDPHVAPLRCDA